MNRRLNHEELGIIVTDTPLDKVAVIRQVIVEEITFIRFGKCRKMAEELFADYRKIKHPLLTSIKRTLQ